MWGRGHTANVSQSTDWMGAGARAGVVGAGGLEGWGCAMLPPASDRARHEARSKGRERKALARTDGGTTCSKSRGSGGGSGGVVCVCV